MTRALNKLNAPKVRTCAPGKYSDGGGLWLIKREDCGGQWVLSVKSTGGGGKWAWVLHPMYR